VAGEYFSSLLMCDSQEKLWDIYPLLGKANRTKYLLNHKRFAIMPIHFPVVVADAQSIDALIAIVLSINKTDECNALYFSRISGS
jgi:hypothetical protein